MTNSETITVTETPGHEDHISEIEPSFGANLVNTINVIGGLSINTVAPGFNLNFAKQEYGTIDKLKGKVVDTAKSVTGYAIGYSALTAVVLEQTPVNENWRINEGLKTLIATANPAAVARRIIEITNYIELGASTLIIAAVFSKSPIVEAPKQAFYKWSAMGEKREEYRNTLKEEKVRLNNNWRKAQNKIPKGEDGKTVRKDIRVNKNKIKDHWKNAIKSEKIAKLKEKSTKINDRRLKEDYTDKPVKRNRADRRLDKIERRKNKKISKSNWKKAIKKDKEDKNLAKLERIKSENKIRIEKGKKPKPETPVSARVLKRTAKELEDFGVALGLGAGIVVFKNAIKDRNYSIWNAATDAVKASVQISLVSGFIGWIVAAGTNKAKLGLPLTDYTLHYEKQAQWVVDYGLNSKFIIGVLLAAQSPSILKKLRYRLPDKERGFQEWLSKQNKII